MNGKKTRHHRSPGVVGLKNSGRSNLRVGIATRDGGMAKLVRGRTTKKAVRLPALSKKKAPPKAEVRVSVVGRGAPLDPGNRDFAFGADFLLDRVSDGGRRDDAHPVRSERGVEHAGRARAEHRQRCGLRGDERERRFAADLT